MCERFTRLMSIQYLVAGYEHVKNSVFNLRLNTGSDGDDETKGSILNNMINSIDWGHVSAIMLLDMSAVFETIDHTISRTHPRRPWRIQ